MPNPPKPTSLKILHGNPGKRPLNTNEPKPTPLAPECPEWLPKEAREKWAELAPELERLGVLTVIDGVAFTGLVLAWYNAKRASRLLNKGLMQEGQKGNIVKHPANQLFRDYSLLMKTFADAFGMTPTARAKLNLPQPPDDDDDFDEFLRSK